MDTATPEQPLRIVVLKWDKLYGDLIRHQILAVWPKADVSVYQLGFDALTSIQDQVPDLFLTGLKIEDMDGLEHLEPFLDKPMPILIVTSRPDARAFKMLQEVRYDGIYDGSAEGLENLPVALAQVIDRRPYVSPSMVTRLKRPRRVTLDSLTEREQVVLAVIGDGSDDQAAADRLRMSPNTVSTHRKAIMRKLGLRHKGAVMLHAQMEGYVLVSPKGVQYPGFQRKLQVLPKPPPKPRSDGPEEGLQRSA